MEEGLKDVNMKKNADGSYSVICRFPTSEKAQAFVNVVYAIQDYHYSLSYPRQEEKKGMKM